MLELIKVVLCEPSHPGNIGAVARAMKNMGLSQLVLVSPLRFPDKQATERASGAEDILTQAKVVPTLEMAIAKCQWVLGSSARQRAFAWPQLTPAQTASKVIGYCQAEQPVALLFGSEQSGLTNAQLELCDYHVVIPANPLYTSLNLAAAVQVISYEIYQAFLAHEHTPAPVPLKASQKEVAKVLDHFEQVALALKFTDAKHPKKLWVRLKRLLAKAQLEPKEINILRGFLKAVQLKTIEK